MEPADPAVGGVMLELVLAVGWGCVAGAPILGLGRRAATRARMRELGSAPRRSRSEGRTPLPPAVASLRVVVVSALGTARSRRVRRAHDERVADELASAVDLLGVSVGAGLTPYLALQVTRHWCGSTIGAVIDDVFDRHRLGVAFDDALRDIGRAQPLVRPLTDTLRTSTRLGAPIAPALVRLAAETRRELRLRAETRARRVPVRLLFPLVFCVLPAFALLTVAPAVIAGFTGG